MMKKAKAMLMKFPEGYFMLSAILAGYTPPFDFNPLFLGVAVILGLQLVIKNRLSGLILASILLIINLLMLFALFSELSEFIVFKLGALQLLVGGLMIWGLNMVFTGLMFFKYLKFDPVQRSAF